MRGLSHPRVESKNPVKISCRTCRANSADNESDTAYPISRQFQTQLTSKKPRMKAVFYYRVLVDILHALYFWLLGIF